MTRGRRGEESGTSAGVLRAHVQNFPAGKLDVWVRIRIKALLSLMGASSSFDTTPVKGITEQDALVDLAVTGSLDLWDYRRRVSDLYAEVRSGTGAKAWDRWRDGRSQLFATHPETPIEPGAEFQGLDYFPYDERWRAIGTFVSDTAVEEGLSHSSEGSTDFIRLGSVRFEVAGHSGSLGMYWLAGYGGGVFVPFRDLTNGSATYGGGRYLLDTAKGADLGHTEDQVVLDFNYSYHPSCVHSDRWSCPLAPAENHLDFAVTAGERLNGGLSGP